MKRITQSIALVVAGSLMLGGCAGLTGRTAGRYFNDKLTTAKVKTRLATEDAVSITRVNVDTYNGTVYLNGIAANDDEKRRFEERAREDGNPVVSNLQVRHRAAEAAGNQPGPAASPSTEGDRHASGTQQGMPSSGMMAGMVSGEVTDIDHATGKITVKTADGTMDLRFPPSAVQNVNQGDHVRVGLMPESAR